MTFKKIVSSLTFSPSLIGTLGFYAKRLRREENIRRLGLIFTIFAIIIQCFAVIKPPQSANASSDYNMLSGAPKSGWTLKQLVKKCTNDTESFATVLAFNGISCSDLNKANSKATTLHPGANWWNFSKKSDTSALDEITEIMPNGLKVYRRPLKVDRDAYVGKTASGVKFAVAKSCGNLNLIKLTPVITVTGNCSEITKLYAIDQSKPNSDVKVDLYVNATKWKSVVVKASAGHTLKNVDFANQNFPPSGSVVYAKYSQNPSKYYASYKITGTCGTLSCKSLTATSSGNNTLLTATPSATQGAAISTSGSAYTFTVINNQTGGVVLSKAQSGNTLLFTPTPGVSYTAQVSLKARASDPDYLAKHPGNFTNVQNNTCKITFGVDNVSPPITPPKKIANATCDELKVETLSRTQFRLTASATLSGGAALKNYTYTVKDSAGKTVFTNTSTSTTQDVTLPDTGTYTASVVVSTSIGDKTSTACTQTITVQPASVCPYNPNLPANDPNCVEPKCNIPGKTDLPANDPNCVEPTCETGSTDASCQPDIMLSKSGVNNTQNNADATTVKANGGDTITFTLRADNAGKTAGITDMTDSLTDTLEYADLVDNGGGTFDQNAGTLSWGKVSVPAGGSITRTFTVRVKNPIPSMARGQSEPTSYDCNIANSFGNTINIPVNCPTPKVVEQTVSTLPQTGGGANLIFAGVLAAVVVFFYARSRQLGKEVRLVRKEFNAGAL
jgi:hypothetical protein